MSSVKGFNFNGQTYKYDYNELDNIPETDPTLTEQGSAADAKATGDQVNALSSRMDSFTHLSEGSTTGDAELIDGRTGANGTTYNNIGTAIRTQVTNLTNAVTANTNAIAANTAQVATNTQDITNVKSDLRQSYPKMVESDATEPDLDITDPSGNVIMRLQDGHIQTKEFDSADVIQDIADIQDDISELSSGKINIQQAVSDAGKALVIGVDGMVSPADVSISVDATLTQEGEAADAKAVGDAIANTNTAKIVDSDATHVDLDITDNQGNVILRLEGGHVKTKNFDSSDTAPHGVGNVDVMNSDSLADMVLTDAVGNVIVQFSNGHIQTKNFDSGDIDESLEVFHRISGDDYIKTFSYNNSESTSQTIEGDFKQGDTILCHFSNSDNDLTDTSSAKYIQYYCVTEDGASSYLGKNYGYCFGRFTLPVDAKAIRADIPSGMLSSGTFTCKFIVYKLGDYERKPNIITVGSENRCMFTSIRDAMDSFTDNNWYNRYQIQIYPGTYNVMDDYTDEEIRESGFVGLWVKNGVDLVGVGHRDEIVIHGELSTADYDLTIRNAISTLNLSGDCGLKNLTVTNKNLRYAVHDDHASGIYQAQTKMIEGCKFVSTDAASGGFGQAAYGAGGNSGKTLIIRNCDLGDRLIIHNYQNQSVPMTAVVENSFARIVNLTDNNNVGFTAKTRISFHNCDFTLIRHMLTSHGTAPSMRLEGTGTHDAMVMTEEGIVYNFGDCHEFLGTSLLVGQAVKLNGSMMPVAQTDISNVYGIVIGNDGTNTFVQTRGYISDILLGLSGLSVGNYITLDSSGIVTTVGATASNAVGIVASEDTTDSCLFIKLLI